MIQLKLVAQNDKAPKAAMAINMEIKKRFSCFDAELVRLLHVLLGEARSRI